jgi:hypothetical protein
MKDPLDALDQYYQTCHCSPVPASLCRTRPRLRDLLIVPLTGVSLAGLLLAAVVLTTTQPSPEASLATAVQITQAQLAAVDGDSTLEGGV